MVIKNAFLLNSGCMAGLGFIAYNSKDYTFLGMSGLLGAFLGGLAVVGLANIFLRSNGLFNIWLYVSLALFLAYILYDMKEMENRAKYSASFDPMTQSIGVYLHFINIFLRIFMIMQKKFLEKNNKIFDFRNFKNLVKLN
jgi:FtsH-binding integral membrane protein